EEDIETFFMPVAVEPSATFINELKQILARNKNALLRLLYQFSGDFIHRVLLALRSQAATGTVDVYELFDQIFPIDRRNTARIVTGVDFDKARASFEILLAENTHLALTVIIDYIRKVAGENYSKEEDILEMLDEKFPGPACNETQKELYAVLVTMAGRSPGSANSLTNKLGDHPLTEQDSARPISLDEKKAESQESTDEGIYVDHAGLVLIHSFLPVLFSTLDLLDDKQQFIGEGSQTKAVHLLSFLACGKMNTAETELLFCKFLCGMPLKTAIAREVHLADNELEECEQLLRAVIQHWDVLKNTSTDGLREAFLSRKGKLDLGEETPVLYVEAKAHDVLLEKLPWGISYVQLPWIDKPFTTMWN
ncbi:MAG TPA: contractile injection system tape measure protein, partial [Chitinophagaceae bacterium]|nr:contractile injection system tape measure protein [Chitinophagaceae bacterium]